jgi:hypothetical protein
VWGEVFSRDREVQGVDAWMVLWFRYHCVFACRYGMLSLEKFKLGICRQIRRLRGQHARMVVYVLNILFAFCALRGYHSPLPFIQQHLPLPLRTFPLPFSLPSHHSRPTPPKSPTPSVSTPSHMSRAPQNLALHLCPINRLVELLVQPPDHRDAVPAHNVQPQWYFFARHAFGRMMRSVASWSTRFIEPSQENSVPIIVRPSRVRTVTRSGVG